MENKEPILILGFGRSGTTWLSDIISKSLGGLILFEPYHPEVFNLSKESCYHAGDSISLLEDIKKHTHSALNGELTNKWLIRNHLGSKLENVSNEFATNVWENTPVIGLKAIRLNFMIPWLFNNISTKILFIKRDLLSVVSSLLKRERFWMEYGFDFHEKKFLEEVITSNKYTFLNPKELEKLYKSLEEPYLKMTFLWVITHIVVEFELKNLNISLINYRDLYTNPYHTTNTVLKQLGYDNVNLHPSYIFTPSMLTLRTFHKERDSADIDFQAFWKDTLSQDMVHKIHSLELELNSLVNS